MKSRRHVWLSTLLLLSFCHVPLAAATTERCDVNLDGTVDRRDIQAIVAARNSPASSATDPRDADEDGMITVLDAKICALQCSRPNCEAGRMLTSGAEPAFEPEKWNSDGVTLDLGVAQFRNNCYNYTCNKRTDTFAQPGRGSNFDANPNNDFTPAHGWLPGFFFKPEDKNCTEVTKASVADGLVPAPCDKACPAGSYKKALVVDPGVDYHWYLQNQDATWSHKPGGGKATNLDAAGKPILDPRVADRDARTPVGPHYTDFCGCFCCGAGVFKR